MPTGAEREGREKREKAPAQNGLGFGIARGGRRVFIHAKSTLCRQIEINGQDSCGLETAHAGFGTGPNSRRRPRLRPG